MEDLNEILNSTICQANFAGFIAESIQGVGGFVQYPKNYIKKAYECVKNRGGLFIIDEVITLTKLHYLKKKDCNNSVD